MWPPSALESLRAQVRQIEGQHRRATPSLPFGVAAVDARLPGGALPLGALHEIAGGGNGAIDGAAAALFAAGIAARTRGKVLWCLTRLDLFAPALAQAGLNSDRVIAEHRRELETRRLRRGPRTGTPHEFVGSKMNQPALKPWPADKVTRRSVAELAPYARNARLHSDAQVAQIAASIGEWGWTMPVALAEFRHCYRIAGFKRWLRDGALNY